MRKLFLTVFLLFLSASYALGCSCWGFHTSEEYIISDFVGILQIEAAFSDSAGAGLYTAEVNPVTIYKGTAPQSFKVAGNKKERFKAVDVK